MIPATPMNAIFSHHTPTAPSQTMFTRAPRLPSELILCILDYLPQRDLWQAARASRSFYEHALQAGLRVHVNVVWSGAKPLAYRRALDKLKLVLDHASVRRALNISVRAVAPPHNAAHAAAYQDSIRLLGPSLRRALPNLVRLHCAFPHIEADAGLCEQPARKLRALTLTDLPARIPPNLFNGDTRKLRYLALVLADTDALSAWEPVAAFARVTHLKLATKSVPARLTLARLFPALRVLVIDAAGAPSTQTVDLRGLALRHFSLAGDINLLDAASREQLKHIPVIEHRTDDVEFAPLWPVETDELCAVAERCGGKPGISVTVGPWRRTVISTYLPRGALPLAHIPHLVSLTVDESLLTAFVQAPVALEHLRELVVDVTTARDPLNSLSFAVPRVRCPALARLVLLSFPTADASVKVGPENVVRLGRKLNMGDARPLVVLASCEWSRTPIPRTDADLVELFSSVTIGASVHGNVPEYYYTCRYSGYFDSPGWDY